MQGQQNTIGNLQETLGFNHGSTPIEGGVDQQICWNNLQNPAQNHLPDYMVSSNATNVPFINPMNQERQNVTRGSLGESSSSIAPNCASQSERKTDHGWSSTMSTYHGPSHICNEQQCGSSNIMSLSDLFSQGSSSSTIPHEINRNPVFEGRSDNNDNDDDCQVMECTPYKSVRPGKERMPSAGTYLANGYLTDDSGDGRPGSSSDSRRFCKRKTLEGYLAQSSGSGSSDYIPLAENSLWQSGPASHSMSTGANISAPTESVRSINMSEHVIPRLGLTMGAAVAATPVGTPTSRSAESSHRNFRVRIDGSLQQDYLPSNIFPDVNNVGNVNLSSEQQLPELLPNIPLDLRSVSAADSGNIQRQPVVMHVPSLHRRVQTRWSSPSSSRTGSSSSFAQERNSALFEEPNSRSVSRNISQHPMFIPSTDGRNLNQIPASLNLAGRNISVAGNVASSSGVHTSSPTRVLHRSPQYHRRLSELVRRSLLSPASTGSGGVNGSSRPLRLSSPVSQEMALSGNHEHRTSSSRERHLDGAIGLSNSSRTLAAAREGRSRLVTEIRNVLDLMRRGEGLSVEDVMILDQSVFFGMPDIQDRHRDMRLDVDNMTYEELLALGERIGDVCTGLSEETISSRLKQRNFISIKKEEPEEAEPCCICREEYNNGDDLGTLECGHDFHTDCIKQWLMQKNLCPVCKKTGLTT
ncbi:probable E3 ubiquitin-protein ligase RHG1A [Solanum dulcamara]|uniref:probable E3 ubiquitin-protein ligase RHG1A n=1 Tax=Solanum dulcamara TaxID=45834 RepID=UPI00248681E6|nr:probable E3 ubiquitin-protein ligase RHG1A [Solanum dulcamara]XP_055811030.1 probable E3 ubiquitin-protein ligase RHG1A [Solanum dulcamara]